MQKLFELKHTQDPHKQAACKLTQGFFCLYDDIDDLTHIDIME